MAIALAVLASPAGAASPAHAQGGGTLAGPPQAGGAQYGAPIVRAQPARPVARYFRVGPRVVVAPNLPKIALRIDEAGANTVSARVVLLPMTETGLDRALRPRPGARRPARGRDVAGGHDARPRSLPRAPARARAARDRPRPQGQRAGPDDADRPRAGARARAAARRRRARLPRGRPARLRRRLRRAAQRLLAPGPGHHGRRGRARRRARGRLDLLHRLPGEAPPATTSSRRAPTATTTSSPTARRARSSSRPSRPCSPASRCATSA